MVCLKSLLSRFLVLINYTMQSSNHFSTSSCFPFQGPGFPESSALESRFFRVQVFQGPGFSGSRFFWVQVFLGPGFSGSRFFRVQVFQGPGPGFGSSPQRIPLKFQTISVGEKLFKIAIKTQKRFIKFTWSYL